MEKKHSSLEVGRAALKIAITESREEEQRVKEELAAKDIHSTAVDFGGEFIQSIVKINRKVFWNLAIILFTGMILNTA